MSECVSLSRPTRVLSVIPVTGAPILHGKATTPTHHRSLDSHRKAPTPSQNQPPHRPPGQKTVLEECFRFQLPDLRFQHSVFCSCLPIMCVFLCLLCCCRDSFPRQNSRMGITALQLNSRCMNTRLPPVFEKSAECGDLCVSHPGQRVFHHHSFHFTQAGACGLLVLPHAMKLWTRRGSRD